MIVCTARISSTDRDRIDVTRKGNSVFGPSSALFGMRLVIPHEEYRTRYIAEMRAQYRTNRSFFDPITSRERAVLLCYCTDATHCHRTMLARDILAKLGHTYEGEIPPHHCHARGCRTEVRPELLMCARHWRMVPKAIQAAVWAHYRPGQCDDKSPSRAWLDAADAAIEAISKRSSQGRLL